VYGERIPSLQELNDHYGKYPRNTSISPLTIKRYEELLEQFEPYRRTNRLLDVGCGDGHFLEVAKRKGWTVYGTEYTSEAVNVGRAKGIEMHEGLIQSFTAAGEFDVITSFEVLEHVLSEDLEARIAAKLGEPTHDPHGDPIPSADLKIDEGHAHALESLQPGATGRVVRVSDSDPEMLRYLDERGVRLGDALEVVDRQPFGGPLTVRFGERLHMLGGGLAAAMRVELD
jgi:Fe2+ transport system protein FeoA